MKNVHLIPTDKPSRLIYNDANQLCYHSNKSFKNDRKWMYRKKFHIYITSDEEITGFENNIWVIKGKRIFLWQNTMALVSNNKPKKIILTTDQDLIKDGIQAIDDDFLEWFVKNPTCECVEVKRDFADEGIKGITYYGKYFVIIPQEEPKQCKCGSNLVNTTNKDNPFCFHCGKPLTQEPKQETLEEAAENYAVQYLIEDEQEIDSVNRKQSFKEGASWQAERMYSEEKLKSILKFFIKDTRGDKPWVDADDEWFEQYKKK